MDKQQVDVYSSSGNTLIFVGGCHITLPLSITELEDKIIAEQQRINSSDLIGKLDIKALTLEEASEIYRMATCDSLESHKVSEVQRHYQHIRRREEEA